MTDFDWSNTDLIAVREQLEIAVYTNIHGDLVPRQGGGFDDDVWIVVSPIHVPELIGDILKAANLPADAPPPISGVPK